MVLRVALVLRRARDATRARGGRVHACRSGEALCFSVQQWGSHKWGVPLTPHKRVGPFNQNKKTLELY